MTTETTRDDFLKSEIVDQTNKMIINDYLHYMKEYEDWSPEDEERFLEDPFAEIPESFSQSYYADMDFVLSTSWGE